jgi:hypothetical protein
LADKSTLLLIDALTRAVADPSGLPLYGNRKVPGLFATSAAARQVAQRCKSEGYLRVVCEETKGKASQEICAITEKGLAYLLSQVSPKPVLEALVHTLEERKIQVAELVAVAQKWSTGVDALQGTVKTVLQEIQKPGGVPASSPAIASLVPSGNGADTWPAEVIACLSEWRTSGASTDCPLPELYRRAQRQAANLSIGAFHDGLRRLHDQGKIYLHPWTGPLYEIPEPHFALLVGHEIAYYASLKVSTKMYEKGSDPLSAG